MLLNPAIEKALGRLFPSAAVRDRRQPAGDAVQRMLYVLELLAPAIERHWRPSLHSFNGAHAFGA